MRKDLQRIAPFLVLVLAVAILGVLGGDRVSCDLGASPAPGFTAVVRAGEGRGDRVDLAALRGRVVVLDFWAHWCRPCRESTPILNEIAASLADAPVSFYGVNVEQNLSPRRVIEEHARLGAAFPTFHDEDGSLEAAYDVTRLPTLVVIDREGVIRHRSTGIPGREALEALIRRLL